MTKSSTLSLLGQTKLLKEYTSGSFCINHVPADAYRTKLSVEFLDGTHMMLSDGELDYLWRLRDEAYRMFKTTGIPDKLFYDDRITVMILKQWLLSLKTRQTPRMINVTDIDRVLLARGL